MKIHVLTLTWNGLDKLNKLHPTLEKSMSKFDWVWHIRDNGSKDGTVDEIKTWENVISYEIGHNRNNFAEGMNFLFEKASPSDNDLVLLLNNDVIIDNINSIYNMCQLIEKTDVGVVGARLLYTGTNKLQHAGVIFGPRYGNLPYHFRHGEESDANAEKNRYFQCVTAAVALVRVDRWKAVGGFDTNFNWAFDDVDLFMRIGKTTSNKYGSGFGAAYCGQTKIFHEESASLKKNPVNKMFMNKNVRYFKEKWVNNIKLHYFIDHELYLKNKDYGLIES